MNVVTSKAWDWTAVSEEIWREAAPEVYPVALRWKWSGRRRVLDLGCGLGRHSLLLAEMGFGVDALDLSGAGTASLKERAALKGLPIRVQVSDMRSLPYPDAGFDAVLAFHVIYHTDRRGLEDTLSGIRRVLTSGGEVFLTLNSRANPSFSHPANRLVEDGTVIRMSGHEEGIPHHYVGPGDIPDLLAGFSLIRMTHQEEYLNQGRRSCHFFVLARRD